MLSLQSAACGAQSHVLFIVVDDLGFDDVGFRSHDIRTPAIDGLAQRGATLDQYYVQDVCSPSRATFMTGRYAMHHSIVDWIPPGSAYGLPLNETTMADAFLAAGYATHAVGKWHLGFYKWAFTPTFRGFQSYVGFYGGGENYFTHEAGPGAYDFRRDVQEKCGAGCSEVAWQEKGQYSTIVFATEATKVVQAHDTSKMLFLYLAFQGVHSPAEVPASYEDAYVGKIADGKRRRFAGMLSCVDEGIGNVTAALDARGMLQDTLVVFTADKRARRESNPRPPCSRHRGAGRGRKIDRPAALAAAARRRRATAWAPATGRCEEANTRCGKANTYAPACTPFVECRCIRVGAVCASQAASARRRWWRAQALGCGACTVA